MIAFVPFAIGLFVRRYEKGNLSDLGIRTSRIWRPLAISAFIGLNSLVYYFQLAASQDVLPIDAATHLAWSLLMLWEVLFAFGWLQIRFDRAFGIIPGIILTACAFALYHVGSASSEQLMGLAITGLAGAVLFRALGFNVFVLWPFAWGVGSAIGTLQLGGQSIASVTDLLGVVLVLGIQWFILLAIFKERGLRAAAS